MKGKSIKKGVLVYLFLICWIAFPMVWASQAFGAQDKLRLSLGASVTGSSMYMFSATMTTEWNKQIPEIDITAVATPGSNTNYTPLNKGDYDLACGSNLANYWISHGMHFAEGKEFPNICVMFPISRNLSHTLTFADSPMKTFKDQEGKSVLIGPRGSAGSTLTEESFAAVGMKAKFLYTTQAEAIDMMKDRRVDLFTYHAPMRWSGFLDIATARPLKLLPMTSEDQKKINEAAPYSVPDVIPAKTYNFEDRDIKTTSDFAAVNVRAGLPEEIVYKLVKVFWESRMELAKTMESLKWVDPKFVLVLNAPLHPGAARYYREQGMQIPDELVWKKK